MKPNMRTVLISLVVGIVLGAAGPLAGWLGSRSDTAACAAELQHSQDVLAQASDLAQARAATVEQELVRARAGGSLLRALDDLGERNFGLATDRLDGTAVALEDAGEAELAARVRALSLAPGQEGSGRAQLLALAGELLAGS